MDDNLSGRMGFNFTLISKSKPEHLEFLIHFIEMPIFAKNFFEQIRQVAQRDYAAAAA